MTWTEPVDIIKQGTVLTAAILNNQLSGNLTHLAAPPYDEYLDPGSGGDYTTSTQTTTKISTNFDLSLTTTGGIIITLFCGVFAVATGGLGAVDIFETGEIIPAQVTGLNGTIIGNRYKHPITIMKIFPNLKAGTYSFSLYWWMSSTGTLTLYAANKPYFVAWEI